MNVELRYFSGTGNSYKIIDTCRDIFNQKGYETILLPITDKTKITNDAEFIGFCFPVYAFGIPRICRKYLLNLPKFNKSINTFVLITAGDPDEAGFSVKESRKVINNKGLNVIYSDVVHMPANWTVSMNPPPKEEAQRLINSGVAKGKKIAHDILNGVQHHHVFNYPPRLSKLIFYKDYYWFKWVGVCNLWRIFRTDETCDSCELCKRICPTGSIQIENTKPKWTKTCEQCMRCVNYCPKQAIYQTSEGSIKGKNIYYEPGFKPLTMQDKKGKNTIVSHEKKPAVE